VLVEVAASVYLIAFLELLLITQEAAAVLLQQRVLAD
jgi:hypothetical protein